MSAPDEHPFRAAVVLGVVLTLGGMAWSQFIRPALDPLPSQRYWASPADVWHVMLAAHFVVHGKLFLIYQAGSIWNDGVFGGEFASGQYQAGPLLPILLAPIAFLGEKLNLGEIVQRWNPHPSMWLVYGPVGMMISSVPFLYSVRSFAWVAGIKRNLLLRIQVAAGALVLIPAVAYYGHYDDVLALSFVILSARDLAKQRWMRAAVMLGVAVAFKQWAWMALPLLFVVTPKEHRLRSLLPSLVAPASFFGLALFADWRFASLALLKAQTCLACGHDALWVPQDAADYIAGPPRLGVFLVALAVAWKMWNRYDATSLTAALGVTLLARLVFEPVVYTYHLVPALALLLLHEELVRGRPWRTLALGTCALLWFEYDPATRMLWWIPFAALIIALAWPACRRIAVAEPDAVGGRRSKAGTPT